MSSTVRATLEAYVAGRAGAEQVVAAVTTVYYRERGKGKREGLRPLMDVIERAAPGVVELAGTSSHPGYDVRPAGRPFPQQYEADLRRAIEAYLRPETAGEGGRVRVGRLGVIARLAGLLQRLLSASA